MRQDVGRSAAESHYQITFFIVASIITDSTNIASGDDEDEEEALKVGIGLTIDAPTCKIKTGIMSCKLTPWGAAAAVRNLSIRTRRAPTTTFRIASRPEQRPAYQTPFLITTRGITDDTNTRIPPQSETPPPTPAEYVPKPPEIFAPNFLNAEAIAALEKAAANQALYDEGDEGLLFNMPDRVGKGQQLQDRYHPVVEQVTKLLMKDGKLSQAQRVRRYSIHRYEKERKTKEEYNTP